MPIEDEIKKELSEVLSNVVLVGEKRKYLTCLATLKVNVDPVSLQPTSMLSDSVKSWVQSVLGRAPLKMETVEDFRTGKEAKQLQEALETGMS